jgi:hypothetical protein
MRENWYLCRVPRTHLVVMLKEMDYNYMRNHERSLRVPDPEYNIVLLAQGYKEEVKAFYELINGRNITNVS